MAGARSFYTEALAIGDELDHSWVTGSSLLGLALLTPGASPAPDSLLLRGLQVWERGDDRPGLVRTLRAGAVVMRGKDADPEGACRAAILLGAAEAIGYQQGFHEAFELEPPPHDLVQVLGRDALAAALAMGRSMRPREALMAALTTSPKAGRRDADQGEAISPR
jgi:hypothetical protein